MPGEPAFSIVRYDSRLYVLDPAKLKFQLITHASTKQKIFLKHPVKLGIFVQIHTKDRNHIHEMLRTFYRHAKDEAMQYVSGADEWAQGKWFQQGELKVYIEDPENQGQYIEPRLEHGNMIPETPPRPRPVFIYWQGAHIQLQQFDRP